MNRIFWLLMQFERDDTKLPFLFCRHFHLFCIIRRNVMFSFSCERIRAFWFVQSTNHGSAFGIIGRSREHETKLTCQFFLLYQYRYQIDICFTYISYFTRSNNKMINIRLREWPSTLWQCVARLHWNFAWKNPNFEYYAGKISWYKN